MVSAVAELMLAIGQNPHVLAPQVVRVDYGVRVEGKRDVVC